jgi:hypothetical protein
VFAKRWKDNPGPKNGDLVAAATVQGCAARTVPSINSGVAALPIKTNIELARNSDTIQANPANQRVYGPSSHNSPVGNGQGTIELALAELTQLQNGNGSVVANHRGRKSNRGRKSMGSEERQEVSLRMKKYWAEQRLKGNL